MKIAIIDDGVASASVRKSSSLGKYQVKAGTVIPIDNYDDECVYSHGSICAKLIEMNGIECELTSVKILDEQGNGTVEDLKLALSWCIEQKFDLINISAGFCEWFSGRDINDLCYRLYSLGTQVIAAYSNERVLSFPACSPYVIGVQQRVLSLFVKHQIWKPDILTDGRHLMSQGDAAFYSDQSSSFACAYASSVLAQQYAKVKGKHQQKEQGCTYSLKISVMDMSMLHDVVIASDEDLLWGIIPFTYDKIGSITEDTITPRTNLVLCYKRKKSLRKALKVLKQGAQPMCILWCGRRMPLSLWFYCKRKYIRFWCEQNSDFKSFPCVTDTPIVFLRGKDQEMLIVAKELREKFSDKGYRVAVCSNIERSYLYGALRIKSIQNLYQYCNELKPDIMIATSVCNSDTGFCDDVKINVISLGNYQLEKDNETIAVNSISELFEWICRWYE